jgi:hypothetical protein
MCDYSLQNVKSRAAEVGDKLITRDFGTGTRGFAAPEDLTTAVCLLPGTELAFSEPVAIGICPMRPSTMEHKTAIFRQVAKEIPHRHHDALEFPNGETVLLTYVAERQHATVLQLPKRPENAAEAEAQKRAAYVG